MIISKQLISASLLFFLVFLVLLTNGQQFLNSIDFMNAQFVNITERLQISQNDQHFRQKRGGSTVIYENDKWPRGRIPYILAAFSQRAIIARAITAYTTRTCIRFTPKQSFDMDYIIIAKIDGCFADFAHVGGPQQVSLADECLSYATVIHELMHVIGFIHEHQRDDRDYFVNILWQNVVPGAHADFEKLNSARLSYYGETYDYFSIMHYDSTEGSRNGQNTLEAKIHGITPLMGKSTDLSLSDIKRINRAYNCYNFLTYV
ncbi:unnamed protein product [Thelazia callipaeda]|uniref:Metalloendopeptidase n=1 Tax=Thelazia callipaeda TaxID=103827 RepID=A0A0N5CWY6_THECL|nr:unnamed protein product [Thelazia callipaeda]